MHIGPPSTLDTWIGWPECLMRTYRTSDIGARAVSVSCDTDAPSDRSLVPETLKSVETGIEAERRLLELAPTVANRAVSVSCDTDAPFDLSMVPETLRSVETGIEVERRLLELAPMVANRDSPPSSHCLNRGRFTSTVASLCRCSGNCKSSFCLPLTAKWASISSCFTLVREELNGREINYG